MPIAELASNQAECTEALKIVCNGVLKSEKRPGFVSMMRFFQRQKRHLNFIACCSVKATEVKSLK
ncbi:hypothetical protein TUM17568_11620 [Klebsiella oxytoca]|nr:hypothetical protein TUM17568_11620 [Klebsiella oxytoca]